MLNFPNCFKNIFFQLVADTQRSIHFLENQSRNKRFCLELLGRLSLPTSTFPSPSKQSQGPGRHFESW